MNKWEDIILNDTKYQLFIQKGELLDYLELINAPYTKKLIDYGNGELLCEFEAHILDYITQNPGVLICNVADNWGYSICSASKTVKKLVDKGLIEKRTLENNKKSIHLYPTEKGLQQNQFHLKYDQLEHTKIINALSIHHSTEELDTFFSVIESYISYLKNLYSINGSQ